MTQRFLTACLTVTILLATAGAASAQVVTPIHQYVFNGVLDASDRVGTAHGTLIGATTGGGQLILNNGPNLASNSPVAKYLSLPATAFPNGSGGLSNFTLEFFLNWTAGGQTWARIFDFNNNTGANPPGGADYMFLGPISPTTLRYAITDNGPAGEFFVNDDTPLPGGTSTHVALTYDAVNDTGILYVNGLESATNPFNVPLDPTNLAMTNFWFGRSAFAGDPTFNGTMDEIRIYNSVLTPAQMLASFQAGPVPLPEPTALALVGAAAAAGVAIRRRRVAARAAA